MRKIYLFLMVFVVCLVAKAQTLNVSAGWPNSNWAVTGSYGTAAIAFESDPRTTANFAFDDDDAGNSHKDIIAAESPVIDLTAAHAAGENFLEVTAMYGFRRNVTDLVRIEYWNVATSAWVVWSNVSPNYTLTTIVDNFCTIPKTLFTSDRLNISSFSPAQLSGFKYRIYYNDNIAGPAGWGWGFCFDSPTIASYSNAPVANCDAVLTSPANGATDVALEGILTWSAATGAVSGYKLAVSTTPNNPAAQIYDAGNVLTYNIPGLLAGGTTYYVKIIAYNLSGDATGCTEYSFTTREIPVGSTCTDPHVVDSLPFTTTDNTSNYLDLIDGSPGASGCGTTSSYLNGNDVVYSYTATADTTIKIVLDPTATYTGIFVYGSCADIGVNCLAGVGNSGTADRVIDPFPVVQGQTYYIVISTWADPQTSAYTLTITENTCTNAAATYTVVSNCDSGNDEFFIDVNVTSLGSASSLSISDNQGVQTESVTATGVYQFGPYANATNVIITIENEQDSNCVITSPARTQAACPPVNDDPEGAIDLVLDLGTACGANAITGISNAATTGSNVPTPSCGNYTPTATNGDLWFKFEAPAAEVKLNVTSVTGMTTVSGLVYSGAIGSFVEVAGTCSNGWPKTLTGLTPGDTYYIRAWDYGNDQIGTFTLCGYYLDCVVPAATYTVVSNCASGNDEFFVDVNVTNVGSASSLTISDNQGNAESTSTTGIVQMGPYNNGTSVIITVANDDSAACTITSTARTQATCPPINDTCANAIDLATQTSPLSSTTVGATNDYLTYCTNSGTSGTSTAPDIYYSILVPSGSSLKIYQTVNNYDSTNTVFYGDCSNRTQIACFDDPDETVVNWSNNTGSDQTVYWIQDGISGSGTFTLAWELIDCVPPVATYTLVSNCASGNDEFFVDVDVTSVGSASSLTISDNQGNTESVSATGIVQMGPYNNGTSVIINVANDDSPACTITSTTRTQAACPPANDACADAIELTAGATFAQNAVTGTNASATRNPNDPTPTCEALAFTTSGKDVWYSVVAPASGTLTAETATVAGTTLTDTGLQAYRGTCGALVSILCNTDDGEGNFSKVVMSNLTPGETILLRVWGYNGTSGSFQISAYDASLSTVSFDNTSFKVYPNPVKDVLKLSYSQDMTSVSVFNLLGQEVINKSLNASEAQVDMSNLSAGTYLVKVAVDNQVKTVKVVKQ